MSAGLQRVRSLYANEQRHSEALTAQLGQIRLWFEATRSKVGTEDLTEDFDRLKDLLYEAPEDARSLLEELLGQ